jgi:hypothetical protein
MDKNQKSTITFFGVHITGNSKEERLLQKMNAIEQEIKDIKLNDKNIHLGEIVMLNKLHDTYFFAYHKEVEKNKKPKSVFNKYNKAKYHRSSWSTLYSTSEEARLSLENHPDQDQDQDQVDEVPA